MGLGIEVEEKRYDCERLTTSLTNYVAAHIHLIHGAEIDSVSHLYLMN